MAGQIFSGNINALATSWMMIYMLMFAVAWEAWTGFLERRAEDNKAQMEMLSKVGRELIILGFIAFGVILLKELNVSLDTPMDTGDFYAPVHDAALGGAEVGEEREHVGEIAVGRGSA